MPHRWLTPLAVLVLAAPAGADTTFNKDVAPIVWKNCAGCHRPGEVGPFPLLTYKDAAKRADFIARVTADKLMPPWKAEAGFGKFHDERRLSQAEIATLADWAKAGAPEGDPRDLPPAPKFTAGWQLGEPDLIAKMPEAFTIPASGRDVYRSFVIPLDVPENRTVAAVEFRPGNRKVVHHAIMYLDSNKAARKLDAQHDGPGFRTFGGPGFLPSGSLGAWTPGTVPRPLPEGTGRFLRKNSDLVLQIHYHPSGKEETDQSTVGIYFTKVPAKKYVAGVGVINRRVNIPAGEHRYHLEANTEPLPADVTVMGVTPHMHLIGKEMKAVARTPDGAEVPLIWIKDWDFNWQGAYALAEPFRLPKGTVVHVDAYYDNSSDNTRNPSSPPKVVTWGEQTTDEMCICGVQVAADSNLDLLKVMRMKAAMIGAILEGSVPTDVLGVKDGANEVDGVPIPANGVAIPERAKVFLSAYDKDKNGRLDAAEIKAMPDFVRGQIVQAIRERLE